MNTNLLGLVLLASLSGCAEVPFEEEEGESSSELVSDTTFARASNIVGGIDYLAFGYKPDGCYARALYMSAELAAEGIESNALYASAQGSHRLRIPASNGTWAWHVAPMLKVATKSAARREAVLTKVLDPSMSKAPLDVRVWVAKMGYAWTDPDGPLLASTNGSDYPTHDLGLDFAKIEDAGELEDVASFKAMGKFRTVDVQHACGAMHAYLEVEQSPLDKYEAKQDRLIARTKVLLRRLAERGKLAGAAVLDEAQCRSCAPSGTSYACGAGRDR